MADATNDDPANDDATNDDATNDDPMTDDAMTDDPTTDGPATPATLAARLAAIAVGLNEARTDIARQDLWRRARHALNEAGADATHVDRAIGRRSVVALTRFVEDLRSRGLEGTRGDAPAPAPGTARRPARAPAATPARASGPEPSADELKKAMRAFRKRLKLTKLNEESKLGRSPMTSGKKSGVVAIMPPYGYRPEIWTTLVAQGKLRHTGRGFYELADGGD